MKNLLSSICLLLVLLLNQAWGQSATAVFINDHQTSKNIPLDLEIKDFINDTIVAFVEDLGYRSVTPALTLPSTTIMKYTWYNANTQVVFFNLDNQNVNTNLNYFAYFYGTSLSKEYERTAINAAASSGSKIRYVFFHNVPGLQTVDFVVREADQTIANDMNFEGNTFNMANEFDVTAADSGIIDMTDRHNQNIGIRAFKFKQSDFAGKSIFLFTSGTDTDMQMFAVTLDGTITELTPTEPILIQNISQELDKQVSIYPNPFGQKITIEAANALAKAKIEVYNPQGQLLKVQTINQLVSEQ
ncbi:MAG: T9SS type A sorting domain-containing protein, partial [Bacteroidetes bacterium]|nr:T9SS type A sorting domain-containing protein [Bacteroidota bacterium]